MFIERMTRKLSAVYEGNLCSVLAGTGAICVNDLTDAAICRQVPGGGCFLEP
jgi:hypothetical protein